MTLEELRVELALIMEEKGLNAYATYFTSWINSAVLGIANEFVLPALRLKDPVSLTVTESNWLYDLPASYMKKLYKCYDSNWDKVTIKRSLDDLDELDIDHDDTGDHVTHVAVRDTQIGIYPMAAENIKLWYYEKPTDLVNPSDILTCIPAQCQHAVIISKIILKNIHLFSDKTMERDIVWWSARYKAGLFGEPGGDIGMLNVFARDKKPRRHGGRQSLP